MEILSNLLKKNSAINKLELDNKPVRVKARNTVEAIRKAFYAKGGSGKDWVAADVDVLKKL